MQQKVPKERKRKNILLFTTERGDLLTSIAGECEIEDFTDVESAREMEL